MPQTPKPDTRPDTAPGEAGTLTNEYDGDAARDGIPANGTRPTEEHSPEGIAGPPPRTV